MRLSVLNRIRLDILELSIRVRVTHRPGTRGLLSFCRWRADYHHLNAAGIRRTRYGHAGAGRKLLTRTAYIGRHRFNTRFWKTRERKLPLIIEQAEFEEVQALLKTHSPALIAPRIVRGPTHLFLRCLRQGHDFCAPARADSTVTIHKIALVLCADPHLTRLGLLLGHCLGIVCLWQASHQRIFDRLVERI